MSGAVARRYTQGLFDYATEHGLMDAVDAGLKVLSDALDSTPEFKSLIAHPLVSAEEKIGVVTNVFGSVVDPVVIRFVRLLLERGRGEYLQDVYESFHAQAEAAKGLVSVRIETAFALTDEQVDQLQKQLGTALNKQARAVVEVNPELIAGFRVHVGNRVMDATVQGALEQFGSKLLDHGAIKEGTH